MFDEEIRASFAAQAKSFAEQANRVALAKYLRACENWSVQVVRGAAPVVPTAITANVRYEPTFGIEFVDTGIALSAIKPESFLPTYGTDLDAVGGPVGGPIPGSPGKWYAVATAAPNAGDIYEGYRYVRPTPFGGYWERL